MTQFGAYFIIVADEIVSSSFASTKSSLKGVNVVYIKGIPHTDPCSTFFFLLHRIGAVIVPKRSVKFGHEEGELFWLRVQFSIQICMAFWTAAVKKHIFLSRVPMQINVHDNFLFFMSLNDHFLQEKYLGMIFLTSLLPLPVQIKTRGWEAIVSIHNSIDVYHWYDFEEECFTKF